MWSLIARIVQGLFRNKIFLLLQNSYIMLAKHLGPDFRALRGPKEEIAAHSDCQVDFGNHAQCFATCWLPKYFCEVFLQIIINMSSCFPSCLPSWCPGVCFAGQVWTHSSNTNWWNILGISGAGFKSSHSKSKNPTPSLLTLYSRCAVHPGSAWVSLRDTSPPLSSGKKSDGIFSDLQGTA